MTEDERAIRALVATWMEASKAGDIATVLTLMSDDVVFMVPGQKPFGKEAFAKNALAIPEKRRTLSRGWGRGCVKAVVRQLSCRARSEPGARIGLLNRGGVC
jgi:ketosteroid isomerase-like protein